MKAYKWILCIVLVFAICFCFIRFGIYQSDESTLKAPSDTPVSSEPPVTEFSFSSDAFCERLLSAVNAYRAHYGQQPWATDESLFAAAKTRATECSILGSKSHKRPDGSDWFTVLGIAENYNYSEITGISGQAADDLLRKWVSSGSINNSLLDPQYTACGVACEAIGSDVYTVLILYKP